MEKYTLKDLERLTGIKYDTIRMWEKRHNILKPARTKTNRRYYDDNDLMRMINISVLNRHGFRIASIASMTDETIKRKAALFFKDDPSSFHFVVPMLSAMNKLDEPGIRKLLSRSINRFGFEATFTNLVFPFLQKVGVLWQTGSVSPGTEHFITGIFRSTLISAIDSMKFSGNENLKRFILFLPEGELHELGLLFYAYMIQKRGHKVLYLGQSTPLESVVQLAKEWKAGFIITGAMSGLPLVNPSMYLKQLKNSLKGVRIFVSGFFAEVVEKSTKRGIIPLRKSSELLRYTDI